MTPLEIISERIDNLMRDRAAIDAELDRLRGNADILRRYEQMNWVKNLAADFPPCVAEGSERQI